LIDAYYQTLLQTIDQDLLVVSKTIAFKKYTEFIGYIRGVLTFLDGSSLHFREYLDFEETDAKRDYSYHYHHGTEFMFRYDNTPHHRQIPTFPHHVHRHSEMQVQPCSPPDLAGILAEIGTLVRGA
jgi:hypothetical protein